MHAAVVIRSFVLAIGVCGAASALTLTGMVHTPSPATRTGVREKSATAAPSWPWLLLPQHHTSPAALTAQV